MLLVLEVKKKNSTDYISIVETNSYGQQCEQRGNIDIVAIRHVFRDSIKFPRTIIRLTILYRPHRIEGRGMLLYRRIIKIRVHCTQGY